MPDILAGSSPDYYSAVDYQSIDKPFGPVVEEYFSSSGVFFDRNDLVKRLLYNIQVVPADPKKYARNFKFIPGCTFSGRQGPFKRCDVMVVGQLPAGGISSRKRREEREEPEEKPAQPIEMLLGDAYGVLVSAFNEVGIPKHLWELFYMTNIVRFVRPTKTVKGGIQVAWKREGYHLLEQELRIIKPKYILCLGSEASKHFTKYPVTRAQSHVFDYTLFDGSIAKVVCVDDPKRIIADFEKRPQFVAGIRLFANMLLGREQRTIDKNYFYVDDEESLSAVIDELIKTGVQEFVIDCEWGGQSPLDRNSGLRTVQIGWNGTCALVVVLRRQYLKEAFHPYISSAIDQLRRLLCRPGVRIIGHNIMADYPWLFDLGIDILPYLYFDTMLASHLFEPTASHALEDLAVRIIPGWQRHDVALEEWKKENPFPKSMGYRTIPDDILHPYAAADVCSTYLVYDHYHKKLQLPQFSSLHRLFYFTVMPAVSAFIEIELNGVYMDMNRLLTLERMYREKYEELLDRFQVVINDRTFNTNSTPQKQNLLFKKLGLTPVKETGKYPKMWEDIVFRGEEELHEPAVDGETLDILSHRSPVAGMLREICLLGTVLKTFLPAKELNPLTGQVEYLGGLTGGVKHDGRLRTRIGQMLKTGRLSSSDPNLQNMPNKQESPIEKIFENGIYRIRSAFTAPVGSILIISDFKQAEIATLAYLSGDPALIAAVERGEDIHSVVGRKMFKLEHLTNAEFKEQHNGLRIASKSIVFGLLYGRGAAAIAREVEKAGVPCTAEQAQEFVDLFMQQFPLVKQLILKTHKEVMERGWVENLWGRREYFYRVGMDEEDQIEASQRRKGFNFLKLNEEEKQGELRENLLTGNQFCIQYSVAA